MFICRNNFGDRFESLPHETQALFFQMARYIHGGGSWEADRDGIGAQMHRLYGVPLDGVEKRLKDLAACGLIKFGKSWCTLYCGGLKDSVGYSPIERLRNDYSHLMPALESVAKMFIEKEIEQGRKGLPWFQKRLTPEDFRSGK